MIVGKPVEIFFRIRLILVKRPEVPGGIAARSFHLDNIGSQITQNFTAEKSCFIAEIENPAIFEQLLFSFH